MGQSPPPPQSDTSLLKRGWHFLRKVIVWSLALYVINLLLHWVGWTSWESFSKSADTVAASVLGNMKVISPFTLYQDLRSTRMIAVVDSEQTGSTPAVKPGPPDKQPLPGLNEIFTQKRGLTVRELTAKEKVVRWCRGFWYGDGGRAFWFGRIVLLLVVLCSGLLAIQHFRSSADSLLAVIPVFLWYTIQVLAVFAVLSFVFYVLVSFILMIGSGLVALFTGVTTLGGFFYFMAEEVKSEAVDRSKKAMPFIFSSLLKVRK